MSATASANQRKLTRDEYGTTALDRLPVTSSTGTNLVYGDVTDSAASGTAIACGFKTYKYAIGVRPDGSPARSLAKLLQTRGFKIGMISTSPINDATPAAHYACMPNRKMYSEIVDALAASQLFLRARLYCAKAGRGGLSARHREKLYR